MKKVLWFVVTLASACGGGGTTKSDDPRCATLCEAGSDVFGDGSKLKCSGQSVSECKEQCGAKIYGESTSCGNCLLENTDFRAEGEYVSSCGSFGAGESGTCGSGGTECSGSNGSTSCTTSWNGVTCTYDPDDQATISACYKKLYPDGTVTCDVDFDNDLGDCKDYCTT